MNSMKNAQIRDDIVCMTVITEWKKRVRLIDMLTECGAKLINVEFGWGSASVSQLSEMFGFDPDGSKAVIICLLRRENADKVFSLLNNSFNFEKANTGIAFTIALDKLVF